MCVANAPATRRSRVRIPLKPWFFFRASSFQLLKLENLLRWSFFTFNNSYIRNFKYNCHAYSSCWTWKSRDLRSARIVKLLPLSTFSVSVSSLEIKQFISKELYPLLAYIYSLNSWGQEPVRLCQMKWLPNDVNTKTWFYLYKASAPGIHFKEFYTIPIEFFQSVGLLTTLLFTKICVLNVVIYS